MKASQLLKNYEQGRRDFRGEDLRGQSFQGKNLTDVDLSHADIRGANFTKTNLTRTKFCQAKGGLTQSKKIILGVIAALLAALSGSFAGLSGGLVLLIFDDSHLVNQIAGWITLLLLMIFCVFSYFQGIIGGLKGSSAFFVAILAISVIIAQAFPVSLMATLSLGIIFILHVTIALVGALVGAIAGALAGATVGAVIGVGGFPLAILLALTFAEMEEETLAVTGAVSASLILTILSIYLGLRSMKGDNRDIWLRQLAFAFAAMGGTRFYGANLTDADLTQATVSNSDFRKANLTHTRFYQTQHLDCARVSKTILAQPAIRDLLVDPTSGFEQSYYKANLQGANLDYANLNGANLKRANLKNATLRYANLEGANLTKILASGTDFTGASLHGACIESWQLDSSTKINQVDCSYVFLRDKPNEYGSRERCPQDPEGKFEPGDFEMLHRAKAFSSKLD